MKSILKSLALAIAAFAVAACGDDGYNRRQENTDSEEQIVLKVNPDWTITGPERSTVTEDGYEIDIDAITVTSTDRVYWYLDIMLDEQFREAYGTDIATYLSDELSMLESAVENSGTTFTSVLCVGTQTIEFNRLRSGNWRAVVFGVTTDGELTGDYQMTTLTVTAAEESAGFKSWLGDWTFTGALKSSAKDTVSYNVSITSSDPDYLVTVSGWESGTGCTNDMSSYTYEAQYDRFTNTLLFMGQYLETYTDDNSETFDFGFYGNFYYDGSGNTGMETGEYALTEDVTIAEAFMSESGNASIEALNLNVSMGENEYLYKTMFTSMQYYDLGTDYSLYSYNENIPAFPIVMRPAATDAKVTNSEASCAMRIGTRRFVRGQGMMTKNENGRRTVLSSAVRKASSR